MHRNCEPRSIHNGGVDNLVAGVDGCHAGWLVVRAFTTDGALTLVDAMVLPSFADVLASTADCLTVAVDMPIGLSEDGSRECDVQARQLLGSPGASSVFPAPVRATLAYGDYAEASEASFAVSGKRISRQTFGILPSIREVDAAMTPAVQWRVLEVHPEVAFRVLNDYARLVRKRDLAGSEERAALLSRVYGIDVRTLGVPRGAARDDLYDAAVCAWTAERIANGTARRLPEAPATDSRGLRMEIWY